MAVANLLGPTCWSNSKFLVFRVSMSDFADDEEEGGGEGWIVSFADLMTLLFAVFVVLYGLKPEGKGDVTQIVGIKSSIREAFQDIPDEIPEDEKEGPLKQGKAVFKYFKADAMRPPIIKRFRRSVNVVNVINKDMEQIKQLLELDPARKIKIANTDKLAKPITVEKDKEGFKIKLVSSYFYKQGEYRPERKSLPMLAHIGTLLKNLGRPVVIEGHTDNVPGKKRNNLELSTLRASYVANYFIENSGLAPSTVSAAGYGDKKPYTTNKTVEGRKLNRRIEIRVKYKELGP